MKKEDSGIKLSIIIPYYKTYELTQELIDILKPQLTKQTEVIIVDDGCNETRLDNQGVTVIHVDNGGVSKARNKGIDKAKGEYISFIDSDDKVSHDYVKTILAKTKEEWDYCIMSWEATGKLKGKYIIETMPPEWNTCVWNTVYSRKAIGNARFNETKTIAEDEDFNNRVRKGVRANITDIMYIYNSGREDSLTDQYCKGKITRELVKDNSIKASLLLYQKSISEIGGVEKLINEFKDSLKSIYDITLVYSDCDPIQFKNLRKDIRCIKFNNQKFVCDKYICVSNQANIADNVNSLENFYAIMIHADYIAMGWNYKPHPKTNKYIAVSKIAQESFKKLMPNVECHVIYNLHNPKPTSPVLRLISCTRLGTIPTSKVNDEKGFDKIKAIANRIVERGICLQWLIYTDHPQEPIKGVAYAATLLDIDSYIKDAHAYVSTSKTESWGYSTVQSLEVGTPVISTDYPAIHEQGLIHGVNGYILKDDLSNLDEIIDKLMKGKLNFTYNKLDNPKQWIKLLGDMPKPRPKDETKLIYTVRAIRTFDDITTGIKRSPTTIYELSNDTTWEVDEDRYEYLIENNGAEYVSCREEMR